MRTYAKVVAAEPYELVAREALERIAGFAKRANWVALFCLAPFIGLAYVVALPFIGFGAIAWLVARALFARRAALARTAKNVALFCAAPFIGLAYAVAFPFVGAGLLVWVAVKAARERRAGV
jgi:hypothetical protein